MSIKSKYRKWLFGSTAAGVECDVQPDGSFIFNLVLLQREKKLAKILSKRNGITTLEELRLCIPKKIPVYLVLNGKGLVHRSLNNETTKNENYLQEILPGADAEAFCLQKVKGYQDRAFVSLIRKDFLEEIINRLDEAGLGVVDCSFGPYGVTSILSLLNVNNSISTALSLGKHKLTVIAGEALEYSTENEINEEIKYALGKELMPASLLLAFAAATRNFSPEMELNPPAPVRSSKDKFYQKKIFRTAGTIYLGLLLALLFGNYFVFTHYSSRYSQLSAALHANNDLLQQLDTLQSQVAYKKTFLESKGLLQASRSSWYSDQLCCDLPSGIRLEKMNINPLVKQVNDESKLDFRQKTITISGNCKKSSELNAWIGNLKGKKWIKNVKLDHFSQDKLSEQGAFLITIEIV